MENNKATKKLIKYYGVYILIIGVIVMGYFAYAYLNTPAIVRSPGYIKGWKLSQQYPDRPGSKTDLKSIDKYDVMSYAIIANDTAMMDELHYKYGFNDFHVSLQPYKSQIYTFVSLAVAWDSKEAFDKLLEYDAPVQNMDIRRASYSKNSYYLNTFLEKKSFNPNQDLDGDVALAYATDYYENTKLLLEAGADPNIRVFGKTTSILSIAKKDGNQQVIDLLIKYGAKE